jgi:hypothetical protein
VYKDNFFGTAVQPVAHHDAQLDDRRKDLEMIALPSPINNHVFVSDEFNRLRMQARRSSLLAGIFGKNQRLRSLSENSRVDQKNKKYAGVQTIPTGKIVGTISRNDDFDRDFRPRKKHLRERWVNMFILLSSDGWAPIVVHKVGDVYYVEDGHHRVSVARSVGMHFIEAEVWDHSVHAVQTCVCRSSRPSVKQPLCACATD